ncbi:ABC transporter permease [Paenibacillus xylaniclasticus]|uniref:ABC transporter permease n=1 Tax=Paenibacillus xylaniclasticus TaxID=588083 RepID=UPI000FD7416E|nr:MULTISPECIES: ABC-2 family transporter protein [Paenibacillus]GFN30060.1 hypothetical protein PCURB6_03200 [Paenibacillus curdlanolyticus]
MIYFQIIINSFRSSLAYRSEVLLFLFGQLITVFIEIYIWYAIYGDRSAVDSTVGAIQINEMVSYVLLSAFISVFVTNDVIFRISNKVSTGEIGMDLIKPISFKALIFSQMFGTNIYRLFFELIPLSIFCILFFSIKTPSFINLILFIVMVINSIIINYFITYIIGLISLWYGVIWQVSSLYNALILLFSGAFIPNWFFPDAIKTVSNFMPFHLIYYDPISLFLGKIDGVSNIFWIIGQQLLWILLLVFIEKIIWLRGVKKIVVQGG